MTPRLRKGCLVELFDVKTSLTADDGAVVNAEAANNTVGQLLELGSSGADPCQVVSLQGLRLKVPVANLRLPDAARLSSLVKAELIVGPASQRNVVNKIMTGSLVEQGFCLMHNIDVAAGSRKVIDAVSSLHWQRVPADFEPHYLGINSQEKTFLLDWDDLSLPASISESKELASLDDLLSVSYNRISQELNKALGIRASNRTNMLVRQTFANTDEETEFPAVYDARAAERLAFLSLVHRRRVCCMEFLGPSAGMLTLVPKSEPGDIVELKVTPGAVLVFCTQMFNYSFESLEGQCTTLQCWHLTPQSNFEFASDVPMSLEALIPAPEGPSPPARDPIAVVGLGVLLGGSSHNWEQYFIAEAKAGVDSFLEHPVTRWEKEQYCDWTDMVAAINQGKAYTRHQGVIDNIDEFDNRFFNIGNNEAMAMDPNQRKILESTYVALAMGGHSITDLARSASPVAIMVGVSGSEWGFIPHAMDPAGCGGAEAIISNRINFSLNLKGASQTINTACSAGLVAIHNARLYLKTKEEEELLGTVGAGVQISYSPMPFVACCGGSMLSFKGRSFTFDKSGDGYGRGEGCSAVYFEHREWTDEVFALLAASQSNQDGRSASITAPNGPSQEKCIQGALRGAKLTPTEVDCFECHGTGTALGDPIEIQALRRIYTRSPREHALCITSSKSNLGHGEGNAGNAGFIKCVMQVYKAEASPNVHLRQLNPNLDMSGFDAHMETEGLLCEYSSAFTGVSSFGFGGTNAHGLAYGKCMGAIRGYHLMDARRVFLKRINEAPPPEIAMVSDDPEQWETTGVPIVDAEESDGKEFQIEMSAAGKVVWREVVEDTTQISGSRFYITGTFNDWGFDEMEREEGVSGLFSHEIEIGEPGSEHFQIVVDEDTDLIYYPAVEDCISKTVPVKGPGVPPGPSRELFSWRIVGTPGEVFRVELYSGGKAASVTWMPVDSSDT